MPTWTRKILDQLERGPLKTDIINSRDYATDVGFGLIEGHSRFTILGNNPDVDSGTVPEHIWPGGGLYPWIPAAGVSLEVISSSAQDSASGTGISRISLTLLATNYVQSTVTVALNGTSAVSIPGTWLRINAGRSIAKGSGANGTRVLNAGDITIRDAGAGTTRGILPANKGFLRQCVFTVPLGFTAQVVSMYIGFNRGIGGGPVRYMTASTYIQSSNGVAILPLDISCDGEPYRHDGYPGIVLPEKTDFAIEVISCSSDNSDITGAALGILKDNNADQI